MNFPPEQIDGANVICYVVISSKYSATGITKHWVDDELLGQPSALAICQYDKSSEYYLFYCDQDWETQTDTSHSSLNEAKHQAESEFIGISNDWILVTNS